MNDEFQRPYDDDEISLSELFAKIVTHKWYVLMGYVLVVAGVTFYTRYQPPVYEASSLLLINNESSTPQLGEIIGLNVGNKNVANEIEIIKSRTIALRVADALRNWRTVPGTNELLSALAPSEDGLFPTQVDVAGRLQNSFISVRPVNPDVDLIEITTKSTIPRAAALWPD